jgi:hypothetical protein
MQTPPIQAETRSSEKGSVLIYIFIAIVLFAALSFAVSRGNREGVATIDRERADLQATQILDYTGMIRRSLQNMKISGVKDSDLCFDHTGWGFATYNHAKCSEDKNKVFLPTGGGSSFQAPGEQLLDESLRTQPGWNQWHFTGANRVIGVGEDCTTNGECNELLLVLPYVKREICAALNRRLQVNDGLSIPLDDAAFDITKPYAGAFVAGDAVNTALLNGKRSGCFQTNGTPSDGSFLFYAVLSAQ